MPESLSSVLTRLEHVAAYAGAWRPLRDELPVLTERIKELRERESRMNDVLVVALVGGSGVGKSSLLNAIAGDELAKTSEFRPCTSIPTVYHPPGTRMPFEGWNMVAGSALENLAIIDTPDSDTIAKQHRVIVEEALAACDLIVICGSPEKYLDEATWSLLRPLSGQRAMVCVETKATPQEGGIREHWLGRLKALGIDVNAYFRVNSRRTLDRKLTGRGEPTEDEFDFPRFEVFLRQELNRERVQRIKRSNVSGLLTKTITRLQDALLPKAAGLDDLEKQIREADAELAAAAYEIVRRRLFSEPHLWNFALGREIGLRAKGFVGTLFRIVEAIRTLPARASGWLPWGTRFTTGHQAAKLLSEVEVQSDDVVVAVTELDGLYKTKQSELSLALAQDGFSLPHVDDGFAAFRDRIQERVATVLRRHGRDALVSRAKVLTNWPLTLLLDAPPLAFLVFTCYLVVETYFTTLLPGTFFLHSAAVLAIILLVEMFTLSIAARMLAWGARQSSMKQLRTALAAQGSAFVPERAAIAEARHALQLVDALKKVLSA